LRAEPLFVINCGMSHKEVVPMNRMAEWVQDALDAIEYANGPANSRFGAMRAKAGHPAPFHLKFMEIGNENGGPAYQERFPLFYDAIKARYPQMTLIANEPTTRRRPDVVDEHYYNSPGFFISNAHKYDAYDRRGPRIYVGEYAVTAECGQGNLQGAIGEAAFMTGLERNSDVVSMASYAPLFANVNYKKWNPDLINFDGSRVYGLPSYYVQKMFSENRGDVILPTTVKAAPVINGGPIGGAMGLGTWSTQAEFKDICVRAGDKTLFAADFAQGSKGWKPLRGKWSTRRGVLRQTADETDCRIIAGDRNWSNYTLSLKARKLGGAEGFLVMCSVRDENQWIWWNLGGWGNRQHGLEQCIGGNKSMLGKQVPGRIETGRWYDIRIQFSGDKIRCYLDGQLIHDVSLAAEPLYAVASRVDTSGQIILKVVNVSRVAQDTELELRGVQDVRPMAKAIVLSSANPTDENSLTEPTKVASICQTIDGAAAKFRHTFPANSVTILRLTAR
jgi:alpha-L-arabinofuranosidase